MFPPSFPIFPQNFPNALCGSRHDGRSSHVWLHSSCPCSTHARSSSAPAPRPSAPVPPLPLPTSPTCPPLPPSTPTSPPRSCWPHCAPHTKNEACTPCCRSTASARDVTLLGPGAASGPSSSVSATRRRAPCACAPDGASTLKSTSGHAAATARDAQWGSVNTT
eukprot:356800-Chlamydomonas_euryale.AAC.6